MRGTADAVLLAGGKDVVANGRHLDRNISEVDGIFASEEIAGDARLIKGDKIVLDAIGEGLIPELEETFIRVEELTVKSHRGLHVDQRAHFVFVYHKLIINLVANQNKVTSFGISYIA